VTFSPSSPLGQPCVGTAIGVRLAAHDEFAGFVTDFGLEFYPIGGDLADLMSMTLSREPTAVEYMVRNSGLMTWQGLDHVINSWWRRDLKLAPTPASMGPEHHDVSRESSCPMSQPQPARRPRCFPLIVYVGFGSIVIDGRSGAPDGDRLGNRTRLRYPPSDLARMEQAWRGTGRTRAMCITWATCSHELLFKRVSAVVHHGRRRDDCLRSRQRAPIPQKELDAMRLAEAIRFCLSPAANHVIQAVAETMRQAHGLDAGGRGTVVSPQHHSQRHEPPALWTYEKTSETGRKGLRLSNQAGACLLESRRVKITDLNAPQTNKYGTDVQAMGPSNRRRLLAHRHHN
ncbi:hypothetical protein CTA1_3008, partial [Colletotrichum tanaceti]